ncbi:hypothetical protein [Nostoc sphaeroides]|uniref:Uncharacterized protein n=1 Tax=Nostoc sphaeroides CCNUC1 TaxID=2653204 RepID=A0A5P8VX07_9NOSO|nr:hypothetical protein [Nostoc sphaeroides]QFS44963.1 hypothetical protein GXM_02438 [Nostoc sphaeroides CCNUC1]
MQSLNSRLKKGATGVIQFQGGDRRNGKIRMVTVRRNCNSNNFVPIVSTYRASGCF